MKLREIVGRIFWNDNFVRGFSLISAWILEGHTCTNNIDLIDDYPTGSIRVSFGYSSTYADADKLIHMIVENFVSKPANFYTPISWAQEASILKEKFKFFLQDDSNNNSLPINFKMTETLESTKEFRCPLNVTLLKIHVYPIKSCGAFDVSDYWPLTETGLKYDREWMIISANGVALTQKRAPRMCLITPRICLIRQTVTLSLKDENRSHQPSITIPLDRMLGGNEETLPICHSRVCGDDVTVSDWGDDVAEWFQTVLEMSGLRLVKIIKRNKPKSDVALSFSNQAQYLLITEASIKWLDENMSRTLVSDKNSAMRRFRSNFVVGGDIEALEELTWEWVDIGNARFKVESACNRCYMICIDQSSGEKNSETLTALASAQRGNMKFGIYLNLINVNNLSKVKIGDKLTVSRKT